MTRYRILLSIKGVGPVAAITLLVWREEIGLRSGKAAAMLTGLAPLARDSGDKTGQRHIRGGRAHVRTALSMAAVAASRSNPDLAAFYKRLSEKGKAAKIALVAVIRKLVVLANTLNPRKIEIGNRPALDNKHRCSSLSERKLEVPLRAERPELLSKDQSERDGSGRLERGP
ncbi:MAG: transposase [Methylocella sp.]